MMPPAGPFSEDRAGRILLLPLCPRNDPCGWLGFSGASNFCEPSKSALPREEVRPALGVVGALPRRVGAQSHVEERSDPGLREAEALTMHREFFGEARIRLGRH